MSPRTTSPRWPSASRPPNAAPWRPNARTIDRLIATHLADRIGATFTGRIAGVTRAGLFVKLADTGADGFVPAATLGDEYFRYEEAMHALGRLALWCDTAAWEYDYRLSRRGGLPSPGALRFEVIDDALRGSPTRGVRPARNTRDVRSSSRSRRKT